MKRSLNIDDVFTVPHIVLPGETIASVSYEKLPGGKGANQSIAAKRGGAEQVFHLGKVGKDGEWLVQLLRDSGVHADGVEMDPSESTGHAIIQVSHQDANNSIILFPGSNQKVSMDKVRSFLSSTLVKPADWMLLQNEINGVADCMRYGHAAGVKIIFNPAPFPSNISEAFPLDLVSILVVNEVEAESLGLDFGATRTLTEGNESIFAEETAHTLFASLSSLEVLIITLGSKGAIAACRDVSGIVCMRVNALENVEVVDTTGAGDTFVGYFIARLSRSDKVTAQTVKDALVIAVTASGMACEKKGAIPSIPLYADVSKRVQSI
ncbi:hypothetical protein HDU76_010761 [Blyttiomyces sp. JEL0837]|nr:hypothetical protein HDU76_010761 [Blyttiomyces sp. JEL0837]